MNNSNNNKNLTLHYEDVFSRRIAGAIEVRSPAEAKGFFL
jgi:hypothetical protein